MNLKNRTIIEDYRRSRAKFERLGAIVHGRLQELMVGAEIAILCVEHRIKTERSLAGKLERTGERFQSLADVKDILGARVICFFSDEVDAIGALVEKAFIVDEAYDKRELLKADSFGYASLHYICSLQPGEGYDDELLSLPFEVQIRTNLQHTWSAIEHDLGYKSEFGVPRVVVREFARLAGLLELADDEFVRVRDAMKRYTEDIRQKIIDDRADDVRIDAISLREYMQRNKKMAEFVAQIAAICGAEIQSVDPESYIEQLLWLKKETIGDLQKMFAQNRATAIELAQKALANSELDILSSSVGLQYLCRAELLAGGYSKGQAEQFFMISTGNERRAERQAARLLESAGELGLKA